MGFCNDEETVMTLSVATFVAVINQLLPEPHAGLLSGLLFGTKATLTKDLYQQLITTGTLHIVALSGMNITILASLVSLTLLRVVSRRIASLLTLLLIVGFVWFVGFSPSVIRAAIMGTISLLAVIFGRQSWSILSWILAVGIMLLLNPLWIGDLSFQLSAMATLGIILFGSRMVTGPVSRVSHAASSSSQSVSAIGVPRQMYAHASGDESVGSGLLDVRPAHENSRGGHPHRDVIGSAGSLTHFEMSAEGARAPLFGARDRTAREMWRATSALMRWFWLSIHDDLHITLAAQVFTIPLILWYFHRISLISPLANILIGWLIAPLTVLGWLVAALGWIFLPLGQIVAWVAWVPLQFLLIVVDAMAKVPLASFAW